MKRNRIYWSIAITIIVCLTHQQLSACTIISGTDKMGHTWAGNNEDGFFNFKTYLNVYPSECSKKIGYITFSYDSPENGANNNAQGGVNEAGLFFDFNALDMFGKTYIVKDRNKKKNFPKGDGKVFDHIMSNFKTVQEVIDFFDEYWFEYGFNTAQMHLADKYGNLGIINASGSRIVTDESYQVSTNFSICDNEDGSACWRFPIASNILAEEGVGLQSFSKACEKTAQRTWASTIYSNIHNLNTGELTLFYALDYENPYQTNMRELLEKGQKSYLMMDLFRNNALPNIYQTFRKEDGKKALKELNSLNLDENAKKDLLNNLVLPLVLGEASFEAFPLLEEFLIYNPEGYIFRLHQALKYYYDGEIETAKKIIRKYKKDIPDTSLDTERIINMMNGEYDEASNINIKLNGYGNAKSVMVKGFPGSPQLFFLHKKEDTWYGQFKLNQGIYHYSFIVDGKEILDENTPVVSIQSIFQQLPQLKHRVCIDFTEEVYLKTIRVQVPNKTDDVYIAGNQNSMTNWNSIIRLNKVSDFEREITLSVHLPAVFKFTRGNRDTEAITNIETEEQQPFIITKKSITTSYKILRWKNE